jgi:hypothetical protein
MGRKVDGAKLKTITGVDNINQMNLTSYTMSFSIIASVSGEWGMPTVPIGFRHVRVDFKHNPKETFCFDDDQSSYTYVPHRERQMRARPYT